MTKVLQDCSICEKYILQYCLSSARSDTRESIPHSSLFHFTTTNGYETIYEIQWVTYCFPFFLKYIKSRMQ